MECSKISKYVGDYVNRMLGPDETGLVEQHIRSCDRCAAEVRELQATSEMVRSLNRTSAPVGFEARLRERIACESAAAATQRVGYLHRVSRYFFGTTVNGRRNALRPALAGLACAMMVGGVLFFGQFQNPSKSATDWAYINTCREQHEVFAASNPLTDDSAAMLRGRTQDLAGEH